MLQHSVPVGFYVDATVNVNNSFTSVWSCGHHR
uniref:Uncharacterized protein n=1 Tax=Arundo donax TaxID=35708 RepID=A0A0A9C700_ARUDO